MTQTHSQKSGGKEAVVTLDPAVGTQVTALLSDVSAPHSMSSHRVALHKQLVALVNIAAADSTKLVAEVKKILGAINTIPRSSDTTERPLKGRAISIANLAIDAHSAPKKLQSNSERDDFNQKIVARSSSDTINFMRWIRAELSSPSAKEWNTKNLATACYNLSELHGKDSNGSGSRAWYTMGAEAFETAKILTEQLTARSKLESCSGHSSHNICRTLPHIISALSLGRESSGALDARFIGTLTSIVETTHETWDSRYIVDMLFNPLADTKSVYL